MTMRKRQAEKLRLKEYELRAGGRTCDAPDCAEMGEHRAPKSRSRLDDYYWFCLDHVRAYNKNWNYYEGITDDDMEREIRRSTTWERPTWPFGTARPDTPGFDPSKIRDPFNIIGGEAAGATTPPNGFTNRPASSSPEANAFAVMGLDPPIAMDELKSRYKELVKRHHPDANGGDKGAEERLKIINEAYTTLKRFLA